MAYINETSGDTPFQQQKQELEILFNTAEEENRNHRLTQHTRSASWSHTAWSRHNTRVNTCTNNTDTDTMASIFTPIRVIQGIVPTLTDTVAGTATNNTRFPISPLMSSNQQQLPLNNTTEVIRPTTTTNHVRSRSEVSRHSRQSSVVEIDINETENSPTSPTQQDSHSNNRTQDHMEFYGTITWVEKALPFILLLLCRIMWDHRLGILVFVGLFGTFFHVNSTIRKQVALKEKRQRLVSLGILLFLFANVFFIYYVFSIHNLHKCLLFQKPNFQHMDLWTVFWCVGITDYVVRFVAMAIKCILIIMPRRVIHFRQRGKHFLLLENLFQLYRMMIPVPSWYFFFTDYGVGGEYFAVLSTAVYIVLKLRMLFMKTKEIIAAFKTFWKDTRYGRTPSKEVLTELGDSCPICQEEMVDPVELNNCKHIFCEECIVMWFDRERTCPMCRAKVADDPQWKDGSTQSFIQVF